MSTKSAFISAVGALAASRALALVVGFLAVPLTLSLVSQQQYGIWLMILSFVSWLGFADLGIPLALQYKLIRALHSGQTTLAHALVAYASRLLAAIGALVFAAGLALACGLLLTGRLRPAASGPVEVVWALLLCVAAFAGGLPCRLGGVICAAHARLEIPPLAQILSQLLSFGCLCLAVLCRWSNLCALAAATLLGVAFGPLLVTLWARSRFGYSQGGSPSLDPADRRELRGKGLFYLVTAVGELLILQSDALLIGLVLGPKSVPLFMIPAALWTNFLQLQNMFLQPLWPVLSRAHASGERRGFTTLIQRAAIGSLAGAALFSAGLLLLGDAFVRLWSKGMVSLPPVMAAGLAAYVCCAAMDNLMATILNSAGWVEWRCRYVFFFGVSKVVVGYLTLSRLGVAWLPAAYAATMAVCSISFSLIGVRRCARELALA